MTDSFSTLLQDLGKVFQLNLVPDKYNACSLEIPPLTIQLELDSDLENLLIFTKIIELPPGKFRENVLAEALKANGLPDPRPGVFGYFAATNHLTLHQSYPLKILNGDNLAGLFGSFFELGSSWHESIHRGQPSPMGSASPPPFGIRL
ncbi:MAG TPA: CesT family type III secretion system chaperone [Chlamydiales bacterium]|nr:CesT family type III secretion system chaperone [Chlamydiales bacterium]